MFSVPYSCFSTIHLDPQHPIPTVIQPTLNPKNIWTLTNINNGNCIFSARSLHSKIAEFRFDYLNSFSFNLIDRCWNLRAIRDWIFHSSNSSSSPSPSSNWLISRGKKKLSFFASADTFGNVKYGFLCNETWPKSPAFQEKRNENTTSPPCHSYFQIRFNNRTQPYLDTLELKENFSSGLSYNMAIRLEPNSEDMMPSNIASSSTVRSSTFPPLQISRLGLAYSLERFDGEQKMNFPQIPSASYLKKWRVSAQYFSQFPRQILEGEQMIFGKHEIVRFRRRATENYALIAVSLCFSAPKDVKKELSSTFISGKREIWIDGGGYVNPHDLSNTTLFFGGLSVKSTHHLDNYNEMTKNVSSKLPFTYNSYFSLVMNSDSGCCIGYIAPLYHFYSTVSFIPRKINLENNILNRRSKLGIVAKFPMNEEQYRVNNNFPSLRFVLEYNFESPSIGAAFKNQLRSWLNKTATDSVGVGTQSSSNSPCAAIRNSEDETDASISVLLDYGLDITTKNQKPKLLKLGVCVRS